MSTETVDERFVDIDRWSTRSAVEAMLEGQLVAIASLRSQVAAIAAIADVAAERLRRGGRLAYAGAGTSGRVAVQDGVELWPTYSWPQDRLVFLMAGGPAAFTQSAEGAEDDADAGRRAVRDRALGPDDVLIGVAASGRTPFTVAAVAEARAAGALTIGIANNAATPLLAAADHALLLETGAEVIAGSTRMKAGTAQKAALNMLSTAMMLRCGRIYRGLMVDMRVSNDKLRHRAQTIVQDIAGVSPAAAAAALEQADRDIKHAVLIALGSTRQDADAQLDRAQQNLRQAIADRRAEGGGDA